MNRALRSILLIVGLFALGSFATACANSPVDVVQAEDGRQAPEDGYANNN